MAGSDISSRFHLAVVANKIGRKLGFDALRPEQLYVPSPVEKMFLSIYHWQWQVSVLLHSF